MFGLVLWSDAEARRAIIWCEDHGDLALYEPDAEEPETAQIGPGDLVHVGLSAEGRQRRATALRLVKRGAVEDLPQRLSQAVVPAL